MKKIILATTTTLAFAISAAATGAAIHQQYDMDNGKHQYLLQVATDESNKAAGTEAGAFKNKDPDSTPLRTDDPADVVVKPEPGAEPQPMIDKKSDTITSEPTSTLPATESATTGAQPEPGAEPEAFEGKDQAGMDKTPRTE